MNGQAPLGLSTATWRLVLVAGIAVGVVYALSPLTVWFALAMVLLLRWVRRDLDGDERRTVTVLLVIAIALRVIAVGGLFASTNHAHVLFGTFFGDEEYFIKRSIWIRNVALGIPIHGADLIYAFDEYSQTSFLYVLAFVQMLVGTAPYGARLLGIMCYLTATVVLFRLVRGTLGRLPALFGFALLLFLPSMFVWSISVLKEPLFFLLTALSVAFAVTLVRGPGWRRRVLALAVIVALAAALETIRSAGAALSAASVLGGLAVAWLLLHPRWVLALVVATPIVAGVALSHPKAQMKVFAGVQAAAKQHWGHVATAGWVYKTLDERFYPDRGEIGDMQFDEALRFLVRSSVRYVTVPLPWEARSTATLAYLPEYIVWCLLVALALIGLPFAFRRDIIVAGLLVGHAVVAAATVALISGNIGTLVRHRGLALPYFVWLSGVGACELLAAGRPRNAHVDSR